MPMRLSGLSSGTDWEGIIKKMIEVERRPILLEQQRQLKLEAKRDAWKDVNTRLGNLQNKVSTLKLPGTFNAKTASTTNDLVVTATPSSDAATGTHSVVVQWLALAQRVRSDANTSNTSALGLTAGTITVGKQADGTAATIDVTANDSLNSLADKVNQKSTTVKASVVKVSATDYRLVLTAAKSGTTYAFNGTDTGNVADGTSDALKKLGILYDAANPAHADTTPVNGFNDGNEVDQAKDARVTVDGLTVDRSSNTIDDVITGLTLNLVKESPAETVTITVSRNNQTAVDAVKAFVDQVNSAISLIKEKTAKDDGSGKPGALVGDTTAMTIATKLQSLVTDRVTGVRGTLDSLSQVGITMGKYGTAEYGKFVFDSTKLTSAMETKPDDVMELFGAQVVNVALNSNGATAAASSTAAGYNAADVINGNTNSADFGSAGGGWMDNDANVFPDWVEVAFGGDKTINQLKVYTVDSTANPASTKGIKDFDVQYWDGAAWQTIQSITGNVSGMVNVEFSAVTTSKVRIQVNASNDSSQSRLVEVQAFQKNFGAATRLDEYLIGATGTKGTISSTRDAITKDIDRINKRTLQMEDRLIMKEQQLYRQFGNLEQTLSRLRNQGSWLRAQLGG